MSTNDMDSMTGQTSARTVSTADGRYVHLTCVAALGHRRGAILFSHGFRSAPRYYTRLFDSWSAGGYDVYAPLHIDSVEYPDYESYPPEASWAGRLEDLQAVAALIPDERLVAAGHSYGALVALVLGGAKPNPPVGVDIDAMRAPRVDTVVALSPPGVIPGLVAPEDYASLAVPTLVQTGDRDSFVPEIPWSTHLIAYERAPPGRKYSLVFDGVDHGFGGLIYDPIMFAMTDQRVQFSEAARLSLLFMNAMHANDPDALSALDQSLGSIGSAHLSTK